MIQCMCEQTAVHFASWEVGLDAPVDMTNTPSTLLLLAPPPGSDYTYRDKHITGGRKRKGLFLKLSPPSLEAGPSFCTYKQCQRTEMKRISGIQTNGKKLWVHGNIGILLKAAVELQ